MTGELFEKFDEVLESRPEKRIKTRTISWEIFKYASQKGLIFDDNNPCDYPKRNSISTDAKKQFTITDEKILKLRKRVK